MFIFLQNKRSRSNKNTYFVRALTNHQTKSWFVHILTIDIQWWGCLLKKHVWLLKSAGGVFADDLDRVKVKLVCPFFNPFWPLGVSLSTEEYTGIALVGQVRGWCSPASSHQPILISRHLEKDTESRLMLPQNILPASMCLPIDLHLSTVPKKAGSVKPLVATNAFDDWSLAYTQASAKPFETACCGRPAWHSELKLLISFLHSSWSCPASPPM